jgi:predicted nucleic acid-binding protein
MKIIGDTNVLVRAVVRDDRNQARAAAKVLKEAELIVVPLTCIIRLSHSSQNKKQG